MEHGDFTELADNYARYRPGYSPFVLDAVMGLLGSDKNPIVADVGAGTGIWSRMLAARGAEVTAVEPNEAMRAEGMRQSPSSIAWVGESAEKTTLPGLSFALVTMASSFHWPDFDSAVAEFYRILKTRGLFMALWNTRFFECSPVLVSIENKLHELVPDLKRVSSGRSEFCDSLTERLERCGFFSDVLYLEGFHTEMQTPEHYIGLWKSVNDVRVQAGDERFSAFLEYIRKETAGFEHIEARYKTRAWIARRKD